ncbi:serine protease [Streptomyces sp. NPDC003327]
MGRARRLLGGFVGAVLTVTPLTVTPLGVGPLGPFGVTTAHAIVGGREAGLHEYPFMAALVDLEGRTEFCGGALIGERHVLTAAHCLTGAYADPARVGVFLGDHDLTKAADSPYARLAEPKRFSIHPDYDPGTQRNDIAVVTLDRPVAYDRGVSPIRLPAPFPPAVFEHARVEVAGWGATAFGGRRSPVLRSVTLDTVDNRTCAERGMPGVTPAQICTYAPGRDACQYDSGGPLIHRDRAGRPYVVGLVSYGQGCATRVPGVNTRVSSHLDWIGRTTGRAPVSP